MRMDPPPSTPEMPKLPSSRDDADIRLLCALAAAHTMFARHDTAANFLALADCIRPGDRRVMELKAMISLRRGQLAEARSATNLLRSAGHPLPRELELIESRAAACGL